MFHFRRFNSSLLFLYASKGPSRVEGYIDTLFANEFLLLRSMQRRQLQKKTKKKAMMTNRALSCRPPLFFLQVKRKAATFRGKWLQRIEW